MQMIQCNEKILKWGAEMKKLSVYMILIISIMTFVGCSKEVPAAAEPAWSIAVEGVKAEAISFTDLDVEKIGTVDAKATMKKKDGTEQEQLWNGVSFKAFLDYLEVGEYNLVIVEASDGYSKEYTSHELENEGSLLAVKVDGKELTTEDGLVYLVVDGKGSNWWIKNVSKITIE